MVDDEIRKKSARHHKNRWIKSKGKSNKIYSKNNNEYDRITKERNIRM